MAMQGIDISNWQNGINLSAVPCDFVIIKATQGTTYVSPDCDRQVQQAIDEGIPFGVYHYVGGGNAKAEADWFIDNCRGYVGHGVLAIDWESGENTAWGDESYLDAVIARVAERTGVVPLKYASLSVFPWGVAENSGCWVAQYADNNQTGYQGEPWNEGAYSCAIRQYSSCGRLDGWGGSLDLNKAYMTPEAWMRYACPSGEEPNAVPEAKPTEPASTPVVDLMIEVYEGRHGNGEDRKSSLGERYGEVQDLINHVACASAEELAQETWAGRYGNGSRRKAALADRYDEIMTIINGQTATEEVYTIQSGDTLSAIAAKYGTTAAALASANGIANPNLIYAGQRIVIK